MLRCLDCMQADIDIHHRCSSCGSSAIGEVFESPPPELVRELLDNSHAQVWQRFHDFFRTNNWGIPTNNKQGDRL